jgi:hypothetical protein
MTNFWEHGDVVAWRGIYRGHIWHAVAMIVVKDSPEEMVLALLPGAERIAEKEYASGRKSHPGRWDFKDRAWELEKFHWRTNRLLILLEREKHYSTMYFWNDSCNEFLCYYVNFQLPFQRSHCGIDTLDLDLDLIIYPNLSYEWKDVEDYQKAIEKGVITPEDVQGIERVKLEVLERLEK